MMLQFISHLHLSKDTFKWFFLDTCIHCTILLSLISHNSVNSHSHGKYRPGLCCGNKEGAGQGGPGGFPTSGHCGSRGGGGMHTFNLLPWKLGLVNKARLCSQPQTLQHPPHPRTNPSVLPKGVSHHSPSEGQALSLAHSRN